MTECPICKGRGTVGCYHIDHFVDIECDRCHGSGEVEMTNEEWIKSLDTEQLAKRLHNNDVYAFFVCGNGGKVPSVESYVEWLKEIHHAE
jgi:RecJ-like exonuclease